MLQRTKRFALDVIRLFSSLPRVIVAQVLGRQLLRSGTSVGAHCREACRAKSNADFISKIESALQELDESTYWLELVEEAQIARSPQVQPLKTEAIELIAIFVSVVRSVKSSGLRK
jgi:four helix bundle protein